MGFKSGQRVVSLVRQPDEDDTGRSYEHCRPGDLGRVIGTYPGAVGPTVVWDRHGTVCDVLDEEIKAV